MVKANAVNENGYRYEGSDPNNYIQMQKSDGTTEMWRIIGLFPDGENGEDVIRVRKVGYERAEYNYYSGNHWPNTTLYTSLKDNYSLTNYKNTVNYKMHLGTSPTILLTADEWYTAEIENTPGATSKASYNSTTTFNGGVGLMYPSDYGYAVLAINCARTIKTSYYTSECKDNNWLYQGNSTFQWLISPSSSRTSYEFVVDSIGQVISEGGDDEGYVSLSTGSFSPVMALKADVVVTGSGTQSDPYIMK